MTEIIQSNIIGIVCAGIMSIATWIVGCMYKRFMRFVRDQDAIKESVLAINYDRLRQACRYHISRKRISPEELRNLEYLYKGYHALGGNGAGTELYNRCMKLEIELEEKHEN